jgi:hypothetical protein
MEFTDSLYIAGHHFFKFKIPDAITILTVRGSLVEALQIKGKDFVSA